MSCQSADNVLSDESRIRHETTDIIRPSAPPCLGKMLCPRGLGNAGRGLCTSYVQCVEAFILKQLRSECLPFRILKHLRIVVNGRQEPEYGVSDYVLLTWIGRVSIQNGYQFGRKAIDSAIRRSNVEPGARARLERAEIRLAFDVYGREGMRREESRPPRANRGGECQE